MHPIIRSGILVASAMVAVAPITARQDVALKDLMPKGMVIGVALNQRQSDGIDTAAVDIITKQFNQISPENLLKFQAIHPSEDATCSRRRIDTSQFGVDRRMQVIGHTLVWHSQTPAWVFQGKDGGPVDRDTLLARMRDHIRTVVGRYKGKIHGWDVVNEAIDEDGTLRKSPWLNGHRRRLHREGVRVRARGGSGAELYYNDFNLEKPAKRAGVIRLVKDLQARGMRIDGIGKQGHWRLDTPAIAEIEATLADLRSTGLKVMITELDINLLPQAAAWRRSRRGRIRTRTGFPTTSSRQLARRYADVFGVFVKHRDAVSRVTFWGLSDGDSWLNRGRMNHPLLWDRQRQPKPAFDAVVEVLKRAR